MNADQEKMLREMAGDSATSSWIATIAQVVLELADKQRSLEFPLTASATSTAAYALATATAADECANSGTLIVSAAAEGPITTAELIRRGCDDELEARALDVVLRCGWPRPDVDLTTGPCIPVPVEMLEIWRHELTHFRGAAALRQMSRLLADQGRIQGLYIKALPDGPLPEPIRGEWLRDH